MNLGTAYLLLSLLAFAFSGLGFSGLLGQGAVNENQSLYLGIMFLFAGIFLVSCFFKNRK
ncbi:MAG: hypothetical protein C4522_05975 [Desulfobacteraceae bacterium]|nr:MAG: hypothetical protein C4522_05975 [Desulfobacteraceae bacterium]